MDVSASNQKISWFRREEESETLDLTPQFQRRPVWTDEQSSYLIDTILSGLPIPEIYIRSSSTPKGKARYEVIDGQQRIRAVLEFGANDLELNGEHVNEKWWLDAGLVNVRQIRRMQDVEFISELFIALVGGPQDKKNTLEEYYANFEASMSDWTDWVAVFERVRDFISTLLPAEELRPWR